MKRNNILDSRYIRANFSILLGLSGYNCVEHQHDKTYDGSVLSQDIYL